MSCSKRQLFYSVAVLLMVVAALNIAAACLTRNSIPRRVMAHARQSRNATVAALGNSLIVAGFDEPAFDTGMSLDRQKGSVNLGLGASNPVEQLLLLRYALKHGMRPRILVYGFYDLQLTAPVDLSTRDFIGNHDMLYYVEPEYGRSFYRLSWHDRAEFEIMRHFPMLVDRSAIWAKVERVRRKLAQEGMPEEQVNRFGRVDDFSLLEAANASEFMQHCEAASGAALIASVREIIREAAHAGINVVFVEMPMHPSHLHSFYDTPAWERYRSHIHTLLAAQGVTYLDASRWMGEESMFADHLHLTKAAAAQFSDRLAQVLKASQKAQVSTAEVNPRAGPLSGARR
jgi:hypothetical protein